MAFLRHPSDVVHACPHRSAATSWGASRSDSSRTQTSARIGSVVRMAAATTTKNLPRPPFLQRLTPHQWSTIDVVIAALFLVGAVGSLFHELSVEPSTSFRAWLILAPLAVVATVPVAVRRRA